MNIELYQIIQYGTFESMELNDERLETYKRIRTHFVYAVKHDG